MSLERILTGCRMSVRVSFSWHMTFAPLTVRELFSILSNGRPPEKGIFQTQNLGKVPYKKATLWKCNDDQI